MTFTYDWDFSKLLGSRLLPFGTNWTPSVVQWTTDNQYQLCGKEFTYNEEIDKGRAFNAFASVTYQPNDQFSINPSIRYGQLKRLEEDRLFPRSYQPFNLKLSVQ